MKDIYVAAERKTIIGSAVVGAVAGALTWVLNLPLQRFFVEPVFCRNADNFTACANGGSIAFNIALAIAAALAVVALVKISGYRPLLVAIAVVATLWNANRWLGVQTWWEATLWMTMLSALAYLLYSWVARVAAFPLSVVVMVVLVVIARLVVASA